MGSLISFLCGGLFAAGLVISGMTNPNIVLGFLDITGDWDPTLLFVMVGAIGFNYLPFKFIAKRTRPIAHESFSLPTKKDLDKRLIIGSAIFGIGWGVLGVCPGPGIVNLVTGHPIFLTFMVSMSAGMIVYKILHQERTI